MKKEEYDYIIIGSGFGGSVSALRLTEKGYKVLVLEKGNEFQDIDFAKSNWDLRKSFWAPIFKCFGILKLTPFKSVFVLSGVGVGGGSLVYGNTLMTPSIDFFKNEAWSGFNSDWQKTLKPFYEKSRQMLGSTKNPWFNEEDKILKEVARDLGKVDQFSNVDVGVYFGDTEKELDPYFNGEGPLRKGCTGCAACMVGCRHGAKNTLVKNYLYFARRKGAKLISETVVKKIEFKNDKYNVHTKSSTSWFHKKQSSYKANGIVLSGGVLGTMDLLLKQKYIYKTLDQLSNKIGTNIRTNSEMLCGVTTKQKMSNGVAISSVMNADENTHVEIVKYPKGSNAMKFLAGPAVGPGPGVQRFINMILLLIKSPLKYLKHYFNSSWAENSVIFLVMQHLDSKMKMNIKKFPFNRISLDAKGSDVPAYIPAGADIMNRYAEKTGGLTQSILPEVAFNIPSTAHILGGVPMGESTESGVINSKMEVFNYPNMYVCDGSIIPCNLGVNPSLTITTLSEYAMSHIPDKF
jgi:cholesterol oxidase